VTDRKHQCRVSPLLSSADRATDSLADLYRKYEGGVRANVSDRQ